MSVIRLQLESEEYGVVARFAEALGVTPCDVAYAALHRLMRVSDDPAVGREVAEIHEHWRHQPPLWSELARLEGWEGYVDDTCPGQIRDHHLP